MNLNIRYFHKLSTTATIAPGKSYLVVGSKYSLGNIALADEVYSCKSTSGVTASTSTCHLGTSGGRIALVKVAYLDTPNAEGAAGYNPVNDPNVIGILLIVFLNQL